jgi:hypothetical protein
MKRLNIFLATALLINPLTPFFEAYAQCYGDAAEAYGCGAPSSADSKQMPSRSSALSAQRPPAALEAFGNTQAPVLPDTRFMRRNDRQQDYVSPEERFEMMRNIVLGRTGNMYNQGLHTSAINGGGQTWRPSSGGAMGRGW